MATVNATFNTTQPLSAQVAGRLRDLIFEERRFAPGDRMPNERDLAKELGVSRPSLREAIKILVANGVLVIRRGVGTFVSETPGRQSDPFGFAFADDKKKLLSDWYQVRLILESEAMEMIAENATDEELEKLEALEKEERAIVDQIDFSEDENSGYTFMRADQEFHSALAIATHSAVMGKILPALHEWVYFGVAIGEYPKVSRKMQQNAKESHKTIVDFLKKRDGKGANLAMRYHMVRALEDIQR